MIFIFRLLPNNPCVTKRNTKNHDCIIVDTKLILFDNNYKCNCKINYEWDALKEECVLIKGSCYGEGRCNETNTIFCVKRPFFVYWIFPVFKIGLFQNGLSPKN